MEIYPNLMYFHCSTVSFKFDMGECFFIAKKYHRVHYSLVCDTETEGN